MLLVKLWDIWRRMRWLRRIDREARKYYRYKQKMTRQKYVVQTLYEGYSEAFDTAHKGQGGRYVCPK